MAGSYATALLDELMGRNRDANPNDKRRDVHWSDPEICKYFICGICPHDLFTNTRADLGACTKMHDESIRREYQRSARCERMGYEDDLLKYLTTVISEADKRIVRGQQRLLMASTEQSLPPTPEQLEMDIKIESIKKEISDLVAEAESLGNEGKVEEAQIKTAKCDELRTERLKFQEMRDKMLRPYEEVYKRRPMEVCEICGAMLFIDDAPQRLDDHIQGKQHVGYARIRAYMAERAKKKEEMEKKNEDGKEEEKLADSGAGDAADSKPDASVTNDTSTHSVSNDVDQNDVVSRNRDHQTPEKRKEDRDSRRDGEHRNRDTSSAERRRSDRDHRRDAETRSRDNESRRHERDRDDRHRDTEHRDDRHRDTEHREQLQQSRERQRASHDGRRHDEHRTDRQKDTSSTTARPRSRSRRDSQPSRNESSRSSSGRHRSRDRSQGRSHGRRDRSRSRH